MKKLIKSKVKDNLTKEEKKKIREEKRKVQEQINKRTKSTKIVSIVVISILALLIINNFIMYFNESYALFFISHISNTFVGLLFYLNSFIPYGSFITIFLIILMAISIFVIQIVVVKSDKTIEVKNKIVNILNKVSDILLLIVFSYLIINCFYLHLPILDNIYFEQTKRKTYTKEELIYLDEFLSDKVLYYANMVDRKDNKVIFEGNINKQVIKDLHNISEKYPILKGLYPPKSYNFNTLMKGIMGSNVYGLTHFYNTYFDYDMDKVIIFNTIAHEYTHTKGLVRENETVFLSCLSGMLSEETVSNYSGYLEAFTRVSYALSEVDPEKASEIEDRVASKCLSNKFDELCNLYVKNSKDYINGAKNIYVASYLLRNYVDYKDELEESLRNLAKIDGEFYLNGEKSSIEKIMSEVNPESKSSFKYKAKINNKKYNKIKDAFKNDRLYISIYQENVVTKDSKDKEDIEKYYLAPFKNYDYPIINSRIASVDYTYERSARLFLEYYECNGFE